MATSRTSEDCFRQEHSSTHELCLHSFGSELFLCWLHGESSLSIIIFRFVFAFLFLAYFSAY